MKNFNLLSCWELDEKIDILSVVVVAADDSETEKLSRLMNPWRQGSDGWDGGAHA